MLDYLTPVHLAPRNEVKFVSDEIIEIGKEILCGFITETGDVFKPIQTIIEQRPARGDWKVRPTFYHVAV